MINVRPDVISALQAAMPDASVTSEKPRKNGKLPAIAATEELNAVHTWTDGRERYSKIRFRIDIWAKESAVDLAAAADSAMAGLGFVRTGGGDVPDENYKHIQYRYEAIFSAVGKRYVYH